MTKLEIAKAVATLFLEEAIVSVTVNPNTETARFHSSHNGDLVIAGDHVFHTNRPHGTKQWDVTKDFRNTTHYIEDAINARGEEAVRMFVDVNSTLGQAGFVGTDDYFPLEMVVDAILYEKLVKKYPAEKVDELRRESWGIGEDTWAPGYDVDEAIDQTVYGFAG